LASAASAAVAYSTPGINFEKYFFVILSVDLFLYVLVITLSFLVVEIFSKPTPLILVFTSSA